MEAAHFGQHKSNAVETFDACLVKQDTPGIGVAAMIVFHMLGGLCAVNKPGRHSSSS